MDENDRPTQACTACQIGSHERCSSKRCPCPCKQRTRFLASNSALKQFK